MKTASKNVALTSPAGTFQRAPHTPSFWVPECNKYQMFTSVGVD